MRKSKTLARIREGKVARIACLGHFIPPFIRQAADAGYDCIWLDLEHRNMNPREIQALLAFFHVFDIDCLLRAPTCEKPELYRYLEDGASGLMIPHVTTRQDAEALVQSVKFPPLGNRGLDGAGFDCGFEIRRDDGYPADCNRETMLVVQIESPEAVENAAEIAAVEGVDGLFVGPGDLSLRLRHQPEKGTLQENEQRVADAARAHGKAWGRPAASEQDLQQLTERGAQLLAFGGDFGFLMQGLKTNGAVLQRLCP